LKVPVGAAHRGCARSNDVAGLGWRTITSDFRMTPEDFAHVISTHGGAGFSVSAIVQAIN
jgi:hypothetical protein